MMDTVCTKNSGPRRGFFETTVVRTTSFLCTNFFGGWQQNSRAVYKRAVEAFRAQRDYLISRATRDVSDDDTTAVVSGYMAYSRI